jgi:hypothetical protein
MIIEVNGPWHFVYNLQNEEENPRILNGESYYKEMVLSGLGYKIKQVTFLDFYRSKGVTGKL